MDYAAVRYTCWYTTKWFFLIIIIRIYKVEKIPCVQNFHLNYLNIFGQRTGGIMSCIAAKPNHVHPCTGVYWRTDEKIL